MDRNADIFDTVEFTWFCAKKPRAFNDHASVWARRHGRPVVGNSDSHRLLKLGLTYSLVDAEPSPDAVLDAVRQGRVRLVTEPVATAEAATTFGSLAYWNCRRALRAGVKEDRHGQGASVGGLSPRLRPIRDPRSIISRASGSPVLPPFPRRRARSTAR
ncbi:MAG: PHP-associated domain-containing protein [Vicinamibacterales bacterium]